MRQFDPQLNLIGAISIPGVNGTEGIAFTAAGNLVISGYYRPTGGIGTHYLYEVDGAGQIVHQRNLGFSGLDRASHLAIDNLGRIYVSSRGGLIEVSPDFSSHRALPYDFDRVSGVAIGPGNLLYAIDQADDLLVTFDEFRQFTGSFRLGNVPTGIEFDLNGDLFATILFDRQLRRVDVAAKSSTSVLTGLNDPVDIAFAVDGTYYLSVNRGSILQHRAANHSIIGSVSTPGFGDSIAVMPVPVPEPSTTVLAIVGVVVVVVINRRWLISFPVRSLPAGLPYVPRNVGFDAVAALLLVALFGQHSANAADDFRIVARSGQPAPGAMPGATFAGGAAMSPVINRHGQVAFTATLDGPGTEVFSAGLWVETEGGLRNVALGGQPGPGLPSTLVMGSFERLGLSDDGRIGFVSGLFGTPGEIDNAFWIGAPGNLRLVAATKTQIVGPNGTLEIATSQPDPIRQWRELRDGTVVFEAAVRLVGNPAIGGVFREANGEITPVALAGTSALGLSPGVSLVNPLLLGVNARGEITYTATLEGTGINTENNRGVWTIDDSGAQLLWRTGGAAPGLPGTTVNRLASTLALDDAGRGILAARFTGPGVTSNRDTALWFGTPENMQLVAREGDHPPGSPGDMNFEDLSNVLRQQIYTPSMSTNGHVAFAAVVGGTGISFPNDETLWLWRDGEFTLLAREGDAAAGVPEGIVFSSFFRGPTVNAHGQVVFSAMLRGDGITGANDTGIWATDRDGHLHLIAREGSQLNLPGGELATVSRFEIPALSSVASPFSGAFNDRGEIVLYAVFTDAPGAFLVSNIVAVPEPHPFLLLMVAVAMLASAKRNGTSSMRRVAVKTNR